MYVPVKLYTWVVFVVLDTGEPSPKAHVHDCMELPAAVVDISVKLVGEFRHALLVEKSAIGKGYTATVFDKEAEQPFEAVAVKLTLKIP